MAQPLVRLSDGTVLQVGPLTGTQVWTIPGRSHRPLPREVRAGRELEPGEENRLCQFCPDRYLETTPEKTRLVVDDHRPDGAAPSAGARIERHRLASSLHDDEAAVRRFGNLFEIVSTASWRVNHGFIPPADVVAWAADYLADPVGRGHVIGLLAYREASGGPVAPVAGDERALLEATVDLLAGSHDVVVPRRHVVAGATTSDQLASSGSMTPDEHADFIRCTIDALADLYRSQPAARYVAVFQNWLAPAGASVEHLHKQLVAIDSYGPQVQREASLALADPELYQHAVLDLARREGLIVAANDHAVAIAGIGHRYPSIELYSTSPRHRPWAQTPEEVRGMSDLLHAMHAATGTAVPTNEEWHHRPPDVQAPMPWRIVLKWRLHVPAGFEGGTKIYVNTIDPWTVRERVVAALHELREAGTIAPLRIAEEVRGRDVRLPVVTDG
ncbi:galactose-1-phosphate uridylyltransferase [Salana multivorans]|uniref:Galactose-1-phosphate uridylyltransferase n=1 Tax=Salana multivorans TaxID=120377 RepID=A0A3N2D765_9MICO|nr:DUF4921 family protein [Salana multivorans]ROR95621.1 galactose-1-phosphate uridylyltransferase [Salana multivorans]